MQKYNFHQHGVVVSLHRKLKEEKTKRHMHSLQIFAKNISFEGVRTVFQARETGACVCSRMNEVSRESRDFFFKIQFLVRDDKHVIMLIFSRIEQKPARLHIISSFMLTYYFHNKNQVLTKKCCYGNTVSQHVCLFDFLKVLFLAKLQQIVFNLVENICLQPQIII